MLTPNFDGPANTGLFQSGDPPQLKAAWEGVEISIPEFVEKVRAVLAENAKLKNVLKNIDAALAWGSK